MFYDIVEGRNAFLDYRNKNLKIRQNKPEKCVLNQKKVFYDILDDRNAFLDYKNKKLKKSKNWDFSKGVFSMVLIKNW